MGFRFVVVFVGFLVTLVVMAACGGIAMFAVSGAHSRVHERLTPIDHAHGRMLQMMSAAQSSLRGYELTENSEFLDSYLDNQENYAAIVDEVIELMKDDGTPLPSPTAGLNAAQKIA